MGFHSYNKFVVLRKLKIYIFDFSVRSSMLSPQCKMSSCRKFPTIFGKAVIEKCCLCFAWWKFMFISIQQFLRSIPQSIWDTKIGHLLLSKPNWFNPYAVTIVKGILVFKVTELEHERQNESTVLSVIKRLSSSPLRQPNVLFSNIWLRPSGITIPSRQWTTNIYYVWPN